MDFYIFILSFILGILGCLSLYFLIRSIFIVKSINKYFHFAMSALGGSMFVFFEILLAPDLSPERILIFHKFKMLGFVLLLAFGFYCMYDMYFKNRLAHKIFLIFSVLITITIPTSLFLHLPTRHMHVDFLNICFRYSFSQVGPTYSLFGLYILIFAIYSIVLSVKTKMPLKNKIHGVFAFGCPLISGLNDFAVTHGFSNNIMICEYTVFIFFISTYVIFVIEDQEDHSQLQKLNIDLESVVQERTKAIKKEEEDKVSYQKQMFQSAKMASVGQLAAGVAHQISQPLTIMSTRLDFIREYLRSENIKNEEISKSLDTEFNALYRISNIVNQLHAYAGNDLLTNERVDITKSTQSALVLFRSAYSDSKIEIINNIHQEGLFIKGNSSKLQQVIMNILSNAKDALKGVNNPRIFIDGTIYNKNIVIKIADNGNGIKKDNLDKIFDPFFSTKPVGEAAGLGLPISFTLVKAMNGVLKVDSKEDMGTIVTLTFPLLD